MNNFILQKFIETSLSSYHLIHLWGLTYLTICFSKHHLSWFPWHHSKLFPHLLLCMLISLSFLGLSTVPWSFELDRSSPLFLVHGFIYFKIYPSISKSSQNLFPELQILFSNWKLDTWMFHKHLKLSAVIFRGLVFKLDTQKF